MDNIKHWTERSTEDFFYSIASDFIEQLQEKMEAIGMSQSKLARAARVSKGYVSRVFKNPGNLSLETIVKFARIVGLKVSVLTYEDINDPHNTRGPISADVFRRCWEDAKRPADMWAFEVKKKAEQPILDVNVLLQQLAWGVDLYEQTTISSSLWAQSGNKIIRALAQDYTIQKPDKGLSKYIQELEVGHGGSRSIYV